MKFQPAILNVKDLGTYPVVTKTCPRPKLVRFLGHFVDMLVLSHLCMDFTTVFCIGCYFMFFFVEILSFFLFIDFFCVNF